MRLKSENRPQTCNTMHVISIDVGYSSLGLVSAHVQDDYSTVQVTSADKIDLRDIPCVENCQLQHSANVVDRIAHFLQAYAETFGSAQKVLIEVQPLGGIVHVEALLYAHFRDKATLISPNAVHKHFKLPAKDYEKRKEIVVFKAYPYLEHLVSFRKHIRKHDMADALCMILYWMHTARDSYIRQQHQQEKLERTNQNRLLDLNKFCYVKPKKT